MIKKAAIVFKRNVYVSSLEKCCGRIALGTLISLSPSREGCYAWPADGRACRHVCKGPAKPFHAWDLLIDPRVLPCRNIPIPDSRAKFCSTQFLAEGRQECKTPANRTDSLVNEPVAIVNI